MNTSLCEIAPCPTRRGVQELPNALVVRPHPDVRESGLAQRRGTARWSSSPAPGQALRPCAGDIPWNFP
ncbi:hypothetical protein GCM10027269_79600 [Kribbella endophytica]